MYLTSRQEAILGGSEGTISAQLLRILLELGERQGADQMIPIVSAHLSGISYLTGGAGALRLYRELGAAGLRCAVRTSINPCGFDLRRFKEMGLEPEFVRAQQELLDLMRGIGVQTSCSCIPQMIDPPQAGDHLAWAESSALSYANTVLGAYTNRESGLTALISGVLGITPNYGMHLDRNRVSTCEIRLDPSFVPHTSLEFSLLGGMLGERVNDGIPFFRGIQPTIPQIKALLAGMATSGQVAMAYFEHLGLPLTILPRERNDRVLPLIVIDRSEYQAYVERFTNEAIEPDLAVFGCPHLTEAEIDQILRLTEQCQDRQSNKPIIWFFCPRVFEQRIPDKLARLSELGTVWFDTCMVVSPAVQSYRSLVVDSYKSYRYLRPLFAGRITVRDRLDLINEVFNGR